MRRHISLVVVCIFSLVAERAVFGQSGCNNFNIAGDWEAAAPGQSGANLYRFTSDGMVTAFSIPAKGEEPQKLGSARYRFDDTRTAKTLEFQPARTGAFPWGRAKMEITHADQASFTLVNSGASTIWVKKAASQYYVVLAAHRGTPPHKGGPAFAMLIKTGDGKSEAESFGLFYRNGERINGPVPDDLNRQFMTDSPPGDDAVLRLQVSPQAYERAMKIMRSWQERAREGTLLFPAYSYLNVIVPMKDIAESLNACGDDFNIYKLTWMLDDELGANVPQWELAFKYVSKLRELNPQAHITSAKFQQNITSRLALPLPEK